MIAIIDYAMGNVRSVLNALIALDAEPCLVADPAGLAEAERIIIPGVGTFGDGMAKLRARGLVEAIGERAASGVPILGVCLGMQLLASRGTEFGKHEGLDLIAGSVNRIPASEGLRIPHVGWNEIALRNASSPLLAELEDGSTFYFVHSYRFEPDGAEAIVATAPYGTDVAAVVQRRNVYGVQFHPEKSQRDGLRLLRNFLELPA